MRGSSQKSFMTRSSPNTTGIVWQLKTKIIQIIRIGIFSLVSLINFYSNYKFSSIIFQIEPKQIKEFQNHKNEFSEKAKFVTQSNESFILNEMEFLVYVTKSPVGTGRARFSSKKKAPKEKAEVSKHSYHVLTIKNKGK